MANMNLSVYKQFQQCHIYIPFSLPTQSFLKDTEPQMASMYSPWTPVLPGTEDTSQSPKTRLGSLASVEI